MGENLNIESLQEKESYDEKNSSSGLSISVDISKNVLGKTVTGKPGMQGSANKGKIKSDYQSVTEQAGIYAGEGGFDINVGKNTDLKGAVISSEATPDKNKISTDTLTYSDTQNKAEYSASSSGYSAGFSDGKLTGSPNPSIPVNGKADSTTKSAISPGTIDVRSGNTDISKINRNTDQALNALGKIFDKETVKEKQELVNLFSQEANKAIGDLAQHMRDKASTPEEKAKWGEGGEYKALLHAVAAGITSSLSGNGFASGALGDGVSQLAQKELYKITDKNLRLIASAIVGAAAAKAVGGNAKVGAGVAYNGVKYNDYTHRPTTNGSILHTKDGWFVIINGVETPMDAPPPGTVFWDEDHMVGDVAPEYIKGTGIEGDPHKEDIYINSWQPRLSSYGDWNDPIEIYVAADENGNDIIVNGHVVLSDETGRVYNQTVEAYESRTQIPALIAGIIIPGGNSGKVAETLIESALASAKGGAVTAVGRAFQKHSTRTGTVFVGEITGNAAKNTEQGLAYINKILSDPSAKAVIKDTNAYGKILEVRIPNGPGARWSADGKNFIGFIEP